jgi:diguanylate cyclase (GGDEF)-like protein/PAS domain S-box-containing protein
MRAGGEQDTVLSMADESYRLFVENMCDGAATVSSNGVVLYANRRLSEMVSCSREGIVGAHVTSFMSEESAGRWPEMLGVMAGHGMTIELELLHEGRFSFPVRVGTMDLDVDGESVVFLTFTDLTIQEAHVHETALLRRSHGGLLADLHDASVTLTKRATHDALTLLPNRVLLVDRITQALAHAKRSGRCTAVLFLDLDGFKRVNDTKGHATGDLVLRQVSDRLVGAVRSMDTVARIGGDEFVVLAPDVDTEVHAVGIGNHLMSALTGNPVSTDLAGLGASIGISVSVGGRGTAEILLDEADTAMYKSKSVGGGHVELFDEVLRHQVEERAGRQEILQSALDEGRITAYYQPIVDLSSATVVGFEALARLSVRDGSVLSPADFMPIAEDTGLVVSLGSQVLAMACMEGRRWNPVGNATSLAVGVNVSGRQFDSGHFPLAVKEALEQSGLDPPQLHLDVKETAILDQHPDILRQLVEIRDLGVQIGLDDFGTGDASLTHLRRLPLTFVKIHQSFVAELECNSDDCRVVSAVIDLAAILGLRSIAEGIETVGQLDRLRELGCDQAQGYYFARPVPPAYFGREWKRYRMRCPVERKGA